MKKQYIKETFDVAVVGGGMSGLIAALAASRHGAKTALIQNRPVLGGNASSEIRMHICGALGTSHKRPNGRETGILEEIMLENALRNPNHSFSIFDTILWEKAAFQKRLTLYLNTHMTDVFTAGGIIDNILCEQVTTEKSFQIHSKLFIDATGDGFLAHLSGADSLKGREGRGVYNEPHAPEKSDNCTMGNTILFKAADVQEPVKFIRPAWAKVFKDKDFKYRNLSEITSGYWWIELGGDDLDTVADSEKIRDELLKNLYGIWDYIKNSGRFDAEKLDLEWVGFLPGKRESRRVRGRYLLTENDILAHKSFDDVIAYGGWPMDLHVVGGIKSTEKPTHFIDVPKVYGIPYRCLLPLGVNNLIMAGRAVSASHIAFGSLRVMGTTSVIGQAAGTAAALTIERGGDPSKLQEDIVDLQLLLSRDDCFLPGFHEHDPQDLTVGCSVKASSEVPGGEAENVINGRSRSDEKNSNCWISGLLAENGEWIELSLPDNPEVVEADIRFDSGLSREVMLSLSEEARKKYFRGVPEELVKDYRCDFILDDTVQETIQVNENYLRHRAHSLNQKVRCNKFRITVLATQGINEARIFEIRLYEQPRNSFAM
jgi:hypothetical protein